MDPQSEQHTGESAKIPPHTAAGRSGPTAFLMSTATQVSPSSHQPQTTNLTSAQDVEPTPVSVRIPNTRHKPTQEVIEAVESIRIEKPLSHWTTEELTEHFNDTCQLGTTLGRKTVAAYLAAGQSLVILNARLKPTKQWVKWLKDNHVPRTKSEELMQFARRFAAKPKQLQTRIEQMPLPDARKLLHVAQKRATKQPPAAPPQLPTRSESDLTPAEIQQTFDGIVDLLGSVIGRSPELLTGPKIEKRLVEIEKLIEVIRQNRKTARHAFPEQTAVTAKA